MKNPRASIVRRSHGVSSIEPLEARTLFSGLTIAQENQLPGTPASQWDVSGAGDQSLQGFATDISVNVGQTVSFKITTTTLAPYSIDIYRMGYYQGHGARLITTIPDSQTIERNQPAPITNASTGLVDCGNWSVSAAWQVPADATSGIYFAKLVRADTGGASHIVFVVRDDSSQSDILFQTADTTWQAYNNYGGNSLYVGSSDFGSRAVKVSYNRPLMVRGSMGGLGSYNSPFHAEYPMVRWLEQNGYDVSYFTDVDSDRFGAEILEHRSFVSVGHDEYWSAAQRANVEAARDAGVNLAFFSGNEVFWKVRWENSVDSSGTPYRTMVCYKESKNNAKIDPSPIWTGTWRDDRFSPPSDGGRPENSLTGTIYMVDRTNVDIGINMQVPAEFGNLRFWRNTSIANLSPGQVATVGDRVVGYETDEDLDNGFRPAGLMQMSSTTFTTTSKVIVPWGSVVGPGTSTHSITLYRANSGALVFGAGTVQWSWGLDGQHINGVSVPDPAMQQATVNLFADMGVQPATLQAGLVQATMSTDVVAPTSSVSSPTSGVTVVGGTPVTINGTASDAGGGVVGGVEVSTDGGKTWHRANGRTNWSYTWTPTTIGPATLLARASDDSGNIQTAFGSVPVTVTPPPTSTAGLVGAWSFNAGSGGTATDSSGRGHHGSLNGATWTTGFFGGGLLFDGLNDLVAVADTNALDLSTGMTLEAWVKPTASGGWRSVLLKERTGGLAYALYASNETGRPETDIHVTVDRAAPGTEPLPVNSWTHLAATFDGSFLRLYANGTLVGTREQSGSITAGSGALQFGGNAVWGEFFQGVIDEVRVYSRPLSESEIRVDLSTPIGGTLESAPPSASISSPANGSTVSGNTSLTAAASDNVGITAVEFLANGVLVGTDTTAPYSAVWSTGQFANGAYSITARARDYAGNTVTSAPVTLNVANPADQTKPTVSLKHPTGGSRVSGLITPWATASDNIGVAGVQFKINGVNIGAEVTTAPYRVVLDTRTLADGSHTLTAVARDVAGNLSLPATVNFTVDNTAPVLVGRSPTPGSNDVPTTATVRLTFSEDVDASSIGFALRHSDGQLVPGSLNFDATTDTATFTPSTPLSVGVTYSATLSAARDLAGNPLAAPATWSFTANMLVSDVSIWGPAFTPAVPAAADTSAVELGLRFRSEASGYITGVRFYKGAGNTGTHVGRLWTNDGQLLGSVTFTNETETGWQQANFDTPIAITQAVVYVVSYHAPVGRYAVNSGYFATAGFDGGVLEALANGVSGGNGVYQYGAGGVFPATSANSSNYWVDVVFSNTLADVTAPTILSRSPVPSATEVGINSTLTARFSEGVLPGSISFVLRDSGGSEVAASVGYSAATFTATLDPSAPLSYNTTYTVTLSGATDSNGNVMTPSTWAFTTAVGPDLTPPTVASRSPASGGANVPLGATVAATFNEAVDPSSLVLELRNASNQLVSATVSYDPASRTATLDPVGPLDYLTTYTVSVRAQDLSGNLMASPVTWSFTTESPIVGATIWPSSVTPVVPAANDGLAVELGVKFRASVDGYITGIRFYKGPGNWGTHVGHLWTSTGTLLAAVPFVGESDTGWQHADLDAPVAVSAGQTYIASYYAPVGRYAVDAGYFTASGVTNGPLTALRNGFDGRNGVYRYGAGGGFPASSSNSSNYWVDVAFTNTPPVDTSAPAVVSRSPAPDELDVAQGANITATLNEGFVVGTATFTLRDASNNLVPGVVTHDEFRRTLTFNPTGLLTASATYTATLESAADAAGNVMGTVSWSFTTAPPIIGATIWKGGEAPETPAYNDSKSVELGVKFRAEVDGYITGIRFYKGAGNTGTHIGRLWDASGTLIANVTFTRETATGWQQANFSQPVAINAGQTYIASYYAPVGRYAVTIGYFASSGTTNGPLTALRTGVDGGNGVYTYGVGGGFPTTTTNSTNYWVDVVYASTPEDLTPPSVYDLTPADGATLVAIGSNVSAAFSEAVQVHTITMVLRDASNNLVPASVTYDVDTGTVTLNPDNDLARGVTYSVTLSGARDAAGHVMAPVSWSFTTQPPDTTPPAVTGVSASGVSSDRATVSWTTDEPSDTQVEYGLDTTYGSSTPLDPSLSTGHGVSLSGLAPGTVYHYRVKSRDAAGNLVVSDDLTFATLGAPQSIWSPGDLPATAAVTDGRPVEVGVKFRSSVAGFVTGVRFYKGAANTGTHIGKLWSATGTLLASVTFTGETASGWQQANFSQPVAISPDTTYVISYYSASGYFAITSRYFTSSGKTSGTLTALANGVDGGNGVFRYATNGGFPTQSANAGNYWVDVVFSEQAPPVPPAGGAMVMSQTVTLASATTTITTTSTFSTKRIRPDRLIELVSISNE